MIDKFEISNFDIKVSQLIAWGVTLTFLIIAGGIIFHSFDLNGLYTLIMVLIVTIVINYAGANMWNVYYEHNFLTITNIYSARKVLVNQFEKIEMTSMLKNGYTIYLTNGEKYQFKISPTDDLKLFFKTDPQFYAKEMTKKLNEVKLMKQ